MAKAKVIRVKALTSFGSYSSNFGPGDVFDMPADEDWLKCGHCEKAPPGAKVTTYVGNHKHQPGPVVHTLAEAEYPHPTEPGKTLTQKQLDGLAKARAAKAKKAAAAKK